METEGRKTMNKKNEIKKNYVLDEYQVEDIDILEDPIAPSWGVFCLGKSCTVDSWGVICG